MAADTPPTHDPPVPPEKPGPEAWLKISVGPAQLGGTAEGSVPPDQAGHLITTFGMLGSAISGIGGAVLTLHIAPSLTVVAFAELVLALLLAVLIAVRGHAPAGQTSKRQELPDGGARPGELSS